MGVHREQELVDLVDIDGRSIGTTTVAQAHEAPGLLHRAFSVLLMDSMGRMLLQQRASVKSRFPLRWANSCCGHPGPGSSVTEAGRARVAEELGIPAAEVHLREIGTFSYQALDTATGRVEREFDHVLVGEISVDVSMGPDPVEVAAIRWVEPGDAFRQLAQSPAAFAPWCEQVLGLANRSSLSM